MTKVLVTGGCGFIGSKVVNKLIEKNFTVHVLDNLSTGRAENIDVKNVALHVKDINDNSVEEIFKANDFQFIIHLAAQTSVPSSIENITADARINILGSVRMIEMAHKYKVEKIIFASSAAIYGDPKHLPVTESTLAKPTSPYGLSKHTVENYLKMANHIFGLKYVILRYSNVYGPKQTELGEGGVVSVFNNCFSKGTRPVIYGDGNQTRDFIYVDDVAEANIASLASKNGIYNISCFEKTSINQLFKSFKKIYGVDFDPIYRPSRDGDIKDSILSNELALNKLRWLPKVRLEEGLKKTVLNI